MSEQETKTAESPAPSRVNSPETLAAERAVAAIMTGLKNYAVFPPEHASTVNMIQGVLRAVNQFSEKHGGLGFEVGKDRLLYHDKAVYEGPGFRRQPGLRPAPGRDQPL